MSHYLACMSTLFPKIQWSILDLSNGHGEMGLGVRDVLGGTARTEPKTKEVLLFFSQHYPKAYKVHKVLAYSNNHKRKCS